MSWSLRTKAYILTCHIYTYLTCVLVSSTALAPCQVVRKFTGHERKVNALAFGPKDRAIKLRWCKQPSDGDVDNVTPLYQDYRDEN